MDKVILVMDVPTSCRDCQCYVLGEHNNFCSATKFVIFDGSTISHHCPLKWIPEKKVYIGGSYDDGYVDGYNDCIDEIIGQ